MKRLLITALAVGAMTLGSTQVALASTSSETTYRGQGLTSDGAGGYELTEELCGTANGAEVDGPYLLWVYTATKASSATITGPWGTANMTKKGRGAFHYVSDWYDPATLIGHVSARGDKSSTNPQLVISHGCSPFDDEGAWCSPGFWRNAKPGAWALTGYSRDDTFNATVPPYWFGATYAANPTLDGVLADPTTYSGAPVPGTSGYPLNAFNATGAMLTDALPGFDYSYDVMMAGGDSACPIDHFGNIKQ
jgi:hypothetical protein